MNEQVRQLEPSALWNHFADLNAVPRPSKKEGKVIAFIKAFGQGLGLPVTVDEVGNVIIKKPASPGMENRQGIVLQSHLDMVHQKNSDTVFNFDTQGIEMYVDGDWVKAKGTTLGADNGIGVSAIMSLLAATDILHPPLEALFTIDEETGMTGAFNLKGGLLDGKILLNLDTEEDNELTIGCAGGLDVTATGTYNEQNVTDGKGYRIQVKGLTGGHSGGDIHLGRGNANKIMNRVLYNLYNARAIRVVSIDGGSLRNAIPREAVAVILTNEHSEEKVREQVQELEDIIKDEYRLTDPNLTITIEDAERADKAMEPGYMLALCHALYACPNGIYRMSPGIKGLVQSSNNLARVLVKNGTLSVQCLARSSVDSEKTDLAAAITSGFHFIQANVALTGAYPGWEPRTDAPITKLMSDLYQEMFNAPAHVNAVHAGLECGILGINYPDMQMISFGPNIYGPHSPDERTQISSVQKFWRYLLEVLKRIPENEK